MFSQWATVWGSCAFVAMPNPPSPPSNLSLSKLFSHSPPSDLCPLYQTTPSNLCLYRQLIPLPSIKLMSMSINLPVPNFSLSRSHLSLGTYLYLKLCLCKKYRFQTYLYRALSRWSLENLHPLFFTLQSHLYQTYFLSIYLYQSYGISYELAFVKLPLSNLSPSIILRLHQTNLHHLHQTYLIKLICICIYIYILIAYRSHYLITLQYLLLNRLSLKYGFAF